MYKAKTGVGCDSKVPLDLTKETRGEIVEFFEKLERQIFGPRCATALAMAVSEHDCAKVTGREAA